MFTGIVQEVGSIENLTPFGAGIRLRVRAPLSARGLDVGQSISVNGTCLTVVKLNGSTFELEAVEETLKKTTFGSCAAGDRVNLELPMRIDGRLDGHLVMGHVDAVGEIVEIQTLESSRLFTLRIPPEFGCYCVRTGSIAVDGVSLTIARIDEERVGVSIIPHTLQNTIFQYYAVSDTVNLEFDVVGKYVERMLRPSATEGPFLNGPAKEGSAKGGSAKGGSAKGGSESEGSNKAASGSRTFTEKHLRELGF